MPAERPAGDRQDDARTAAASILPPLSGAEAVEVTRIHSIAGELGGRAGAARGRSERPTTRSRRGAGRRRAAAGGSARSCWRTTACCSWTSSRSSPRPALEALRQPLEEGRVAIARARHSAVYPARFMLLAATNPCPCGYAGDGERCRCSEGELARHRRRLSGPLLDRIDLLVNLYRDGSARAERAAADELRGRRASGCCIARERQARRLRGRRRHVNAHMDARMLRRHVQARRAGRGDAARRARREGLSARGQQRALRVARTIADLDGSERVRTRDVGAALALRPEPGSRAAVRREGRREMTPA